MKRLLSESGYYLLVCHSKETYAAWASSAVSIVERGMLLSGLLMIYPQRVTYQELLDMDPGKRFVKSVKPLDS